MLSDYFKKFYLDFKIFKLIIYFWLYCGFCYCVGFSLAEVSEDYSLAAVHGLLIVVASFLAEHGLWDVWVSAVVV